MWAYYFLAAIVIWLGLSSLRGGLRFARYLEAELKQEYPEFTPFVTVFVPCRGVDDGMRENLLAILGQEYPAFEIIVVADRADDPALAVVAEACRSFDRQTSPSVRVVIAGAATDSGQKVHNLRAAVGEADPQNAVFAFVDTDARPSSRWLQSLVAPLRDKTIGAATGYRWFVARGGIAAHLRSVWNASIASALGAQRDKNFCWGGSTAIRHETFEQVKVAERWRGTVSDDFTMTRVLHEAALPIKFVPQCLTPSFESCSFHELIEFTTRQLKITRAYAPHLWKAVLTGSLLFGLGFFGGISLVAGRAAMGRSFATPLILLLVIFALGMMKSYLRLRAVRLVIADRRLRSFTTTLAHLTLWPLASLLFLWNALAAISRRITWRGITYELKSSTETVIIRRES
ncbi:MAG TPA: glycosyltransferase family 2 protein [Pyrinomonadaceae bacterium]|nr:glycosyltransferase family 2 protein [Pyrinomonadaceae bacterium]